MNGGRLLASAVLAWVNACDVDSPEGFRDEQIGDDEGAYKSPLAKASDALHDVMIQLAENAQKAPHDEPSSVSTMAVQLSGAVDALYRVDMPADQRRQRVALIILDAIAWASKPEGWRSVDPTA